MAVTAAAYTHMPAHMAGGLTEPESTAIDWITNAIKMLLLANTYVFNETNKDDDVWRSDLTGEVTGTNYTAGGAAVGNSGTRSVVVDTTTNKVQLKAPAVEFLNVTITGIRNAVVYKDTGVPSTSPLIGCIDFGGDQSVNATTFSVDWSGGTVVEFTVV